MSAASLLVATNVALALLVLVPAALVAGAVVCQFVGNRNRRPVTYVDLPGVGRIPVLRA
ncbi:MAG: hypothetical protein ABFS86_02625 [Planctomycetota bacterium]